MTSNGHVDARTLHARPNHPIIDADGHWLGYGPVMRFWGEVNPDFFKDTAVEKAAAQVLAQPAVRA